MAAPPGVMAREEPHMTRLREFLALYRGYRRGGHPVLYSARIAYGCVYLAVPAMGRP